MDIISTLEIISNLESKCDELKIKIKVAKYFIKNENCKLVHRVVFYFLATTGNWIRVIKSYPVKYSIEDICLAITSEVASTNAIIDLLEP